MLELLLGCALLLLAVGAYKLGRSLLYPAFVFTFVWAILVIGSVVLPIGHYALSMDALLVFVLGPVAFVLAGGLISVVFFKKRSWVGPQIASRRKRRMQAFIIIYGIGLLLLIPFFIQALNAAGTAFGASSFAVTARAVLSQPNRAGVPQYFQSLTSIGMVLAYYAAWLYEGSRRDKVVLALGLLGPLVMNTLTFARSPVYGLLVGTAAILIFRRKLSRAFITLGIVTTLVLAVAMGSLLGKGPDFEAGNSPAIAILRNAATYFIGGPVGFSQIMAQPTLVGEPGLSVRFFTHPATYLFPDLKVPNNVLGNVSDDLGNVYTVYYAYWLDGGWVGVALFALLAGLACTTVYEAAKRGNPIAGVALGPMTAALVTSAYGDELFGSSVPWLLISGVGCLLWYLPAGAKLRAAETTHQQSETPGLRT
jgi:oligosaccharide repeat unit polymerase